MYVLPVLAAISSLSFLGYGVSYFISPHMQSEFKRFGLERVGLLTVILQLLGATGLLVGLLNTPILLLSSGGLALLMFLGVLVRLKVGDGWWVTLPALGFMLLNSYIFFIAL